MSRSTWTRQMVDSHIVNCLKQIKDDKERKLRGFQFARMYFDIKDYDIAKRYLIGFLSVKGNSAPAHKLMGQLLEIQKQFLQAAESYGRSLEIDPQQNDVLLKVCQIYSESNSISPQVARLWAEKADKVFPGSEAVFKLKLKGHENGSCGGDGPQDFLHLFISESDKYPWDVTRKVRLLQQYKTLGRINEAFKKAVEVDKTAYPNFSTSLEWYHCFCDILTNYKNQKGTTVNDQFHQEHLYALSVLTALSLEKCTVSDALNNLWSFDQALLGQHNLNNGVRKEDWKVFICEMEAQFFFMCGTVLLNKAVKEHGSWQEACDFAAACFLASYSVSPFNTKAAWFASSTDSERKIYLEWHKAASYRCCQTGHMLSNMARMGSERSWMERIQQNFCNQQSKEKLFQLLFTQPQHRNSFTASYFGQNNLFTSFTPRFPDCVELKDVDYAAQQYRPESLHHTVWICLQYCSDKSKAQTDYGLQLFEGLAYEASCLDTAGPESLRRLDVEAFLYAVVHCEALKQEERHRHYVPGRPSILPSLINEQLCTAEQQNWWASVHKLTTNTARELIGMLRSTLQRGLEAIRSIGSNGLDVDCLVHLARTFNDRVADLDSRSQASDDYSAEMKCLRLRSLHYWKKAVERLERLQRKQPIRLSRNTMFENRDELLSDQDIRLYLDEGHLYLAKYAKEEEKFEEALKLLNQITTPEASFETAVVYKLIALSHQSALYDEAERESQIMLLTRARDALYLTLDRIRGDRFHALNGQVSEEMEILETRLAKLYAVANDDDDLLNESAIPSSVRSISVSQFVSPQRRSATRMSVLSERQQQLSVSNGIEGNGHILAQSTPQVRKNASSPVSGGQRFRPSPDRLDAELRSLRYVQDNMMKSLSDDQRAIRNLVEHLQIMSHQTAERLTGIESKLAIVLEFQRQQLVMPVKQPIIQQSHAALAAARAGVVQPQIQPYAGAAYGTDAPTYDYVAALRGYDSPLYYGAAVAGHSSAQQPAAYSAYTGNIGPSQPANYVIPVAELGRQAEEYSYAGDQFNYEDEYQENALGYEIPENASIHQLSNRDAFLSAGDSDAASSTLPTQITPAILPGFFANATKQKVDDKQATSNASSATSTPTCAIKSKVPDIQQVPAVASAASITAPKLTPVTAVSSQLSSVLSPPKFVAATTSTVFVQSSATTATSQSSGPKTVFGGLTFAGTPVITAQKDDGKASQKAVVDEKKTVNPFATFSFSSTSASEDKKEQSTSVFTGFKFSSPTSSSKATSGASVTTASSASTVASSAPVFGQAVNSGSASFASIAAQSTSSVPAQQAFSKKPDSSTAFQGAGQPLFKGAGKSPSSAGHVKADTSGKGGDDDDDGAGEEYVPDQEFKPLVSLPEVEVVTGEEDEIKLFGERAKLYRMDVESKQWKERGIGEIKILRHRELERHRIVMRREQVLKLCANHYITSGMKLSAMMTSETSVCYFARDFSEGETREEQLCVKFKTSEQMEKFKACFEECQVKVQQAKDAKTAGQAQHAAVSKQSLPSATETSTSTSVPAAAAKEQSLSDLFQAKAGEWDCAACYVRNKPDAYKCAACETANPNAKQPPPPSQATESKVQIAPSGGFTFGSIGANASFKFTGFGSSSSVTPTTSALSVSSVANSAKPIFGFTTPAATTATATTSATTTPISSFVFKPVVTSVSASSSAPSSKPAFSVPVFTFGGSASKSTTPSISGNAQVSDASALKPSGFQTSASTPSFSALAASTATKPGNASVLTSASTKGSNFGTPSFTFAGLTSSTSLSMGNLTTSTTAPFQFSLATPDKKPEQQTSASPGSPDGNELYETGADDEPNISFEPVVTLPDNVEIKTGEEDEDVLYEHRAKLYRFVDGEWKERGIGDVRLLKHRDNGVVRIVMRRERILKLCMNHRISSSLVLQPMPNAQGKAWTWHADDFSEGPEPSHENFSLRFKTEEIANDFKQAFDDAKQSATANRDSDSVAKKGSQEVTSLGGGRGILATLLASTAVDVVDLTVQQKPEAILSVGSECELVEIKMPPEHLIQQARKYKLPDTFYNYLDMEECKGCIGCCSEDYEFKTSEKVSVEKTASVDSSKSASGSQATTPAASIPLQSQIFGATQPVFGSTKPVFGMSAVFGTPSSLSNKLFGSAAVSTTASTDNSSSKPVFGSFSSTTLPTFGSIASVEKSNVEVTSSKTSDKPLPVTKGESSVGSNQQSVFGSASQFLGFGEVSATSKTAAFGKTTGESSFSWAGSGSPLFSKASAKKTDDDDADATADADDSTDNANDEADDAAGDNIHFEPIVQLPECVDLKTGEEDEEEVFRQRAKLYRWEGTEWKERGVGDMKILKSKVTGGYRLLLRREQVHKVACNHLITAEMKLQALQTSETSWCWYAYDYSDEEPRMDKFAIRFKNAELAQQFRDVFETCQGQLNSSKVSNTSTVEEEVETLQKESSKSVPTAAATTVSGAEPLFFKRATVSLKDKAADQQVKCMVEIKVFPRTKDVGARINMTKDDGDVLLNHAISSADKLNRLSKKPPTYELTVSGENVQKFQIVFSSLGAAEDLDKLIKEAGSKHFAMSSGYLLRYCKLLWSFPDWSQKLTVVDTDPIICCRDVSNQTYCI